MQEIWKDIPNYENLYQISNLGNVRSLCFGARNVKKSNVVKLLKSSKSNLGYYKIQLYKDGKSKMFYIHRLVALLFINNPDNKTQVNHIDGNKANNAVDNLEWVTPKENISHAIDNGLFYYAPMKGKKGKSNPTSKTIHQYDLNGNFIAEYCGISEAARILNINASCISLALLGKHKTCKGYVWKYK